MGFHFLDPLGGLGSIGKVALSIGMLSTASANIHAVSSFDTR